MKYTVKNTLKYLFMPVLVYLFYVLFATVFLSVLSVDKAVAVTVAVDACMALVCFLFLKKPLSDKVLGYRKRAVCNSKCGLWLCLLLFVYLFGQCAATVIYNHMGDAAFDSYTAELSMTSTMLYIVLTLIIAPMYEELFFRGIVYRSAKQMIHPLVAAIISALLFAISHGTMIHMVPTFMLGMLLCIIYEHTNSIAYPILFHVLNNGLTLFFGGVVLPDIMFQPMFLMIGIGILLAIIVIMFLTKSFQTLRSDGTEVNCGVNEIHTGVAVGDAVVIEEQSDSVSEEYL